MARMNSINIEDRPQKILVFGAPKTGKSLMVGQLAELGYTLYWLDGENGADVLLQLSEEAKSRIILFSIADLKHDPQFIKVANEFSQGKNFTVCEAHGKLNCVDCKVKKGEIETFDWKEILADPKAVIVFDSVTQLVTSAQNHISRGETFDSLGGVDKDSKREWGHYMAQNLILSGYFTMVQNCRAKVVCISHETELDAEKNVGMKLTIPTGGTSTQSKAVSKYFGHVVHCRLKSNNHGAISGTTSDSTTVAGSRLNINVAKETRGLAAMFEGTGNSIAATPAEVLDSTEVTDKVTPNESVTTTASSQLLAMRAKLNK